MASADRECAEPASFWRAAANHQDSSGPAGGVLGGGAGVDALAALGAGEHVALDVARAGAASGQVASQADWRSGGQFEQSLARSRSKPTTSPRLPIQARLWNSPTAHTKRQNRCVEEELRPRWPSEEDRLVGVNRRPQALRGRRQVGEQHHRPGKGTVTAAWDERPTSAYPPARAASRQQVAVPHRGLAAARAISRLIDSTTEKCGQQPAAITGRPHFHAAPMTSASASASS